MTPELDLTATTATLASAAADAVRLLPSRVLNPVLAGLLLDAGPNGLVLSGTDRERALRLRCPATVHTEGRVLVPAKILADTLRALAAHQVRLVVEGARLAIRTPGARYALPLLDAESHPGITPPPPLLGTVDSHRFASAVAPVAATAGKEDALPVFTGVRLRTLADGRLRLVATDRYRMAIATLPWTPASADATVDSLIPAALLAEVVTQATASQPLALHADVNQIGLCWAGAEVTTALLDNALPDESRIIPSTMDTTVELNADALAGAVRRVGLYTGLSGTLMIEVGEGEVRVRSADPQAGEAEEAVKAQVTGGRPSPAYQCRYLVDALRAFSGREIRLGIQTGIRATLITDQHADQGQVEFQYLVVPLRIGPR